MWPETFREKGERIAKAEANRLLWWISLPLISIIAFFVFTCIAYGQSATIPNLTLDSSPTSTDQLIVHKSGETRAKKTTRGTLRANLSGVGSCTNQVVTVLNSDAAPTCSSITASFITDNTILEADLKVVDSPVDEECLTFESTTGDFEWQTCGGVGGSSNSFETIDVPSGTDPVADSATDTLDLDAGWGIELTGTAASDKLDIARRNPTSYIEIVEEFAGGTTTAGNVGENGLHGYGTTPTRLAAEAGRPGLYRMSTPATDGAVRGIGFAAVNNSSIIDIDDVERAIFIVRPVLNTLVEVRCGFGQDLNNTAYGSDGVYFEFDTGVGLNWTTITRASSTSTTNTTAIAVAANTWYRLEIVRNSSTNYEFYIDGVLVFTHSANKPTIVLNMGCAVEANSAAIRELDYDLYVLTAAVSR